jgi:transcriptional regulator with XRE-family HTH domain
MAEEGAAAHRFADNLRRLLGLHRTSLVQASRALGITQQALSELQLGNRLPRRSTLEKLSDLFGISIDRLLRAPFEELLADELADRERFHRVEAELEKVRPLGVGDAPAKKARRKP